MTKQKNHWYPVIGRSHADALAGRAKERTKTRRKSTSRQLKACQFHKDKKEHKLTRNKHKTNHILKLNKARLEQEQEKLLALQKKNDSFLPDRLEDGSCRLCGTREFTEQEKHELAVEIERMMFGPFTAEEEEAYKAETGKSLSSF